MQARPRAVMVSRTRILSRPHSVGEPCEVAVAPSVLLPVFEDLDDLTVDYVLPTQHELVALRLVWVSDGLVEDSVEGVAGRPWRRSERGDRGPPRGRGYRGCSQLRASEARPPVLPVPGSPIARALTGLVPLRLDSWDMLEALLGVA